MGLVILAALCVAAFAVMFRFFDRYRVPLFPAITVNYIVACISGLYFAPPWKAGDLELLWTPAIALGALFVTIFSLTGISAQKAGAARTTIAGRMSLVLTVAGNMLIFRETIGPYAWMGMIGALAGLVLVSTVRGEHTSDRSWLLPFIIFLGSGIADVGVSIAQRVRTTAVNGAAFTTLCFASAATFSIIVLLFRKDRAQWKDARVWTGGGVLGVVNYASLLLLVLALGKSDLPASLIFPLMNIGAILFATAAGILFFRERLTRMQWAGVALCVLALVLIMLPSS